MQAAFASDATVAVIADWVELDHYVSERHKTTDSRVVRADRIIDDELTHGNEFDEEIGETFDTEILDTKLEERRQRIWEELKRRQDALGEAYPFELKATSTGWALTTRKIGRGSVRIAQFAYIVALLVASFRNHHIDRNEQHDPSVWPTLEKSIASIFQLLSVLAAANVFGSPHTHVYWFGHPRPDHSGFHSALPNLIAKIGLGTLKPSPPYNTERDQDATVDLVAWRPFADGEYGALVLYGQVASGNNWQDKSIHSHLSERFLGHFVDEPASRYLGATFIPFIMHNSVRVPKDGNLAAAIRDFGRSLERGHGLLVDRLRIVELLATGLGPMRNRHNVGDLFDRAKSTIRWIKITKEYCQ